MIFFLNLQKLINTLVEHEFPVIQNFVLYVISDVVQFVQQFLFYSDMFAKRLPEKL